MLFLLLLISGIFFTEAYISVKANEIELEEFINEVIKSVIVTKQFVYVVNVNVRNINYPVVFYNKICKVTKMYTMLPDIYIISGNISEILDVLHQSQMLANANCFIFYVQKADQNIINTLEQYFIYNALFVRLHPKKSYYEIYKMTPDHQLIEMHPKQKYIKIYEKYDFKKFFLKKYDYLNVLYDAAPPFIISPTKGIHTELFNIIGKHINVHLNYIKTKEPPGTIEISPEFINNRTYDIYGAVFASEYLGEAYSFDLTVRFTEDKIVFITPTVLITDNWTIFYGEFKKPVWICFIILLLTLSLVISLTDYLIPEKPHTEIISFLLALLFEGTVALYTRKKSVKIIFINYLIFVLIFTTVYKSQMFDLMRKSNTYNPIKCRTDMLKFNFKVCMVSKLMVEYLKESHDPIEQYITWSSEVVYSNFWGCINMTVNEKNTVSLRSLKAVQYLLPPNVYLDKDGYPLLNVLLKDFHTIMYFRIAFRKGHPFLDVFNKKLITLKETGLVQYQYKIYEQEFEKAVAAAEKKNNFYFKALKLSTLQSVFFAFFALIGISILVFCFEVVLYK
ncbi:Ionotropic receptor 130 [Diabrotica virgifera virgifera]|nr:Ionotropic receptor 130 [Diabrotica virgifera virgifera]